MPESKMTKKIDFQKICKEIAKGLLKSSPVRASRWQSINAPQPMLEMLNYSILLDLGEVEDLDFYRSELLPNLPWADRHFEDERVSGDPINPGKTWREWPYAHSANTHRREGEEDPQFDHSYAERYWPKAAGTTPTGVLESDRIQVRQGIRFPYGDLDDLVTILASEPTTRQAYLPVWFPEDLGAALQGKRVPCSLGYHFICREDKLHMVYYLRSCDFVRHFRDDVYLSIRLLLWVLDQCRWASPSNGWDGVKPGTFTMHITSLHCFQSDRVVLKNV